MGLPQRSERPLLPSYEKIAERAKCARSTVYEAIKALEEAGLLTWVNRIVRIRERCGDLFGRFGSRTRVIRTSNGYRFNDPKGAASKGFPSKSDFPTGTSIQESISSLAPPAPRPLDPANPLEAALLNLGRALGAAS